MWGVIYNPPTYPAQKTPASADAFGATLCAMWLWIEGWLRGAIGEGDAPAHQAELPRHAPPNRARRHLNRHHSRSDVPPVRCYGPFYLFGARRVTRGQFLERVCRLSCAVRIRVCRIIYFSHRKVREAFMALFDAGLSLRPDGLCAAHLYPD